MNDKIKNAISKYGIKYCRSAYRMHKLDGEGAKTIGHYLGLTTRQANAAINAGEFLANNSDNKI